MASRKKEEKVYRSFDEFERECFPNSYKKNQQDEIENKPGAFGSQLASEFIKELKRQVSV